MGSSQATQTTTQTTQSKTAASSASTMSAERSDHETEQAPCFVLGLGGSFNPVHVGHIAMMVKAKEVLEEMFGSGTVKYGWLACALEDHVRRKNAKQAITGGHRMQMTELAARDQSWIRPTSRLYGSSSHCMAAEMASLARAAGKKKATADAVGNEVHVQLVGGDYAHWFEGGGVGRSSMALVFQRRPHTDGLAARGTPTAVKGVYAIGERVLFVDEFDYEVSSTRIREKMTVLDQCASRDEARASFHGLLDHEVAGYLYDQRAELYTAH